MDFYFSTNNAIARLFKEWQKHPKLIVACDFDDTVFDFHKHGTEHKDVLDLLKKCKELGFYITIFTASKPERYEFMRKFMIENGIEIDAINQNVIPLPFGNNGKIYYNILLDDRAGLGQAYTTLKTLVTLVELELKSKEEESQEKPAA